MRAALALVAALAVSACAADYPMPAPGRTIVGNGLIVPTVCRALSLDWRDAVQALHDQPDQEGLILRETWFRQALANCIAPYLREV